MTQTGFKYFVFPYTTISETDFRRLSVLLPGASLLETIRTADLPEWAEDQFAGWPALQDEQRRERVSLYLRGCRELSERYGGEGIMAAFCDDSGKDFKESRSEIRRRLKGRDDSMAPGEALATEAAVFLEMARDLDEKELEMQAGLSRVGELEEEFREILGISPEDLEEEELDALEVALSPERPGVNFMMRQRAASWLRLFTASSPVGVPVLVALGLEALEEILEPMKSECEVSGSNVSISRTAMPVLPCLEGVSTGEFSRVLGELDRENILLSFRGTLEALLNNPCQETSSALQVQAERLRTRTEELIPPVMRSEGTGTTLELVKVSGCTYGEILQKIDRRSAVEGVSDSMEPCFPVLLLSIH